MLFGFIVNKGMLEDPFLFAFRSISELFFLWSRPFCSLAVCFLGEKWLFVFRGKNKKQKKTTKNKKKNKKKKKKNDFWCNKNVHFVYEMVKEKVLCWK